MNWFRDIVNSMTESWFSRSSSKFKISEPEPIGKFPIRQDITVLPADDPKKLRLGWMIYEDVGMVIVNDYALARVRTNAPPHIYPHLRGFKNDMV